MDGISVDLAGNPGADLLQRVPLFRTLGYGETVALSGISHLERKDNGAVIIEQDSLGHALFVLREGSAVVRRRDPQTGETRELARLSAGELFGEMSLVDDQLASADVVATSDVELVVVPRKKFDELIAGNEKLALKVYKCFCHSLAERLRKSNARALEKAAK